MIRNLLTEQFSEPLNNVRISKFVIDVGDGNLTVDPLLDNEQLLAKGTLQYFEKQGVPTHSLSSNNGQATFTIMGSRAKQAWFHLPWSACNGATEWRIHLNPGISSEITAHSNGGNVKLDLSGMILSCVSAETGGGNMELVLPGNARDLNVAARTGGGNATVEIGSGLTGNNVIHVGSGAGNVKVRIPDGVAARIHATTGLGKVIVDPRISKIDSNTYQSHDFDSAMNKVEITAHSGAGNVTVNTR